MITSVLVLAWTSAASADPPAIEPLADNCQAPLELAQEVARLLHAAASHSTSSAACIDGPGTLVRVDQIRVCPARSTDEVVSVDATYTITEWAEGDTRMCGEMTLVAPKRPGAQPAPESLSLPDLCSHTPAVSAHRTRITFRREKGGLAIEVPASVAGFSGLLLTPLDQEHSGGCYGSSGPFVPMKVRAR